MESDRGGVVGPRDRLDALAPALVRKAKEALVQRASESLSSPIAVDRHEMDVCEPTLGQEEAEQVCSYRTLLIPDQERSIAELVDEHWVMQVDGGALPPERRQALGDRLEVHLREGLGLHAPMLACRAGI